MKEINTKLYCHKTESKNTNRYMYILYPEVEAWSSVKQVNSQCGLDPHTKTSRSS